MTAREQIVWADADAVTLAERKAIHENSISPSITIMKIKPIALADYRKRCGTDGIVEMTMRWLYDPERYPPYEEYFDLVMACIDCGIMDIHIHFDADQVRITTRVNDEKIGDI